MTGQAIAPLLSVLETTREELQTLTDLAQKKRIAVEHDDLMALNEVMNREQAMALSLRGLDQKREHLLRELGWQDVPLSSLSAHCPADVRPQVGAAAEALASEFLRYRREAQAARETLEQGLREVEHTLTELGVAPQAPGPGYADAHRSGQKSVTDFRA